jgi:single-stranded DNA-binding protein
MNQLNSLMLEGKIVGDYSVSYADNGNDVCSFEIVTYRKNKALFFRVETNDESTTEVERCEENAKNGRIVRIVGSVSCIQNEKQTIPVIIADHIEYRDSKKEKYK